MAIACLRLFTFPPWPLFPERRVPCFLRRMALATVFDAPLLNLRRLDCFMAGMSYLLPLRAQTFPRGCVVRWKFRERISSRFDLRQNLLAIELDHPPLIGLARRLQSKMTLQVHDELVRQKKQGEKRRTGAHRGTSRTKIRARFATASRGWRGVKQVLIQRRSTSRSAASLSIRRSRTPAILLALQIRRRTNQ